MQSNATTVSKSVIWSNYNAARQLVRDGLLDAGRLNRALGVAQSRQERTYHTTSTRCDCPDSTYRPGFVCKHRIALVLKAED